MPLIIIPIEEVLKTDVPLAVRDYLTDYQWSEIRQRLQLNLAEANSLACCCETCICIFLLFPCIYLCHPCNTSLIFQERALNTCLQLNEDLFQGLQVVSIGNTGLGIGSLYINTDFLPPIGIGLSSAVPVVAEVMYVHNEPPPPIAIATPTIVPMTSNPVSSSSVAASPAAPETSNTPAIKTMSVEIPEGVEPGSTMTVMAPDDITQVVVVVPKDAQPGQIIEVEY